MICHNCGIEWQDHVRWCRVCGQDLRSGTGTAGDDGGAHDGESDLGTGTAVEAFDEFDPWADDLEDGPSIDRTDAAHAKGSAQPAEAQATTAAQSTADSGRPVDSRANAQAEAAAAAQSATDPGLQVHPLAQAGAESPPGESPVVETGTETAPPAELPPAVGGDWGRLGLVTRATTSQEHIGFLRKWLRTLFRGVPYTPHDAITLFTLTQANGYDAVAGGWSLAAVIYGQITRGMPEVRKPYRAEGYFEAGRTMVVTRGRDEETQAELQVAGVIPRAGAWIATLAVMGLIGAVVYLILLVNWMAVVAWILSWVVTAAVVLLIGYFLYVMIFRGRR